jgi:hypothetical protein
MACGTEGDAMDHRSWNLSLARARHRIRGTCEVSSGKGGGALFAREYRLRAKGARFAAEIVDSRPWP